MKTNNLEEIANLRYKKNKEQLDSLSLDELDFISTNFKKINGYLTCPKETLTGIPMIHILMTLEKNRVVHYYDTIGYIIFNEEIEKFIS